MNFAAASRQGFYEDDESCRGMLPFSQSNSSTTSSSTSSHHRQHQKGGLVSMSSYQQRHHQQRRTGGWDEGTANFGCYSSGGGGGGASHQLDLTMDPSSPTNMINNISTDADECDENMLLCRGRRGGGGDCSEGPGGGSGTMAAIEREHMFDKVVTPSDVGKLNRLVIPKQHAEKYFPLDSSTNEKGLLLNFEDRNGKPWRFRYSYWNSSQSYVMTKGWSRFVKEKKLDAGDIVSFQRGVGELAKDRLFIDWRRRQDAPPPPHDHHHHHLPPPIPGLSLPHHLSFHHPWNQYHHPYYLQPTSAPRDPSQFLQVNVINSHPTPHLNTYGSYSSGNPCPGSSGSLVYLRSAPGGGIVAAAASPQQRVGIGVVQVQRGGGSHGDAGEIIHEEPMPMVFESVPVVQGKAAAKRLRLFGVNMECPISESDGECDIVLPSTAVPATLSTVLEPQAHLSQSHSYLSSSFNSIIPTLQLRPYAGSAPAVLQTMPSDQLLNNKGKASMSSNLDFHRLS